jgi:hypothetical protein
MSGKTTLQKYADRLGDGAEAGAGSDAEGTENLGAFSFLRGARERAEMLELRRKGGDIRAMGYSWLERVDFDPSAGLTLYFGSGQTIRIKGRNLNTVTRQQISLLGGILRHRVPLIVESDQSGVLLQADKSAVVVEAIEW